MSKGPGVVVGGRPVDVDLALSQDGARQLAATRVSTGMGCRGCRKGWARGGWGYGLPIGLPNPRTGRGSWRPRGWACMTMLPTYAAPSSTPLPQRW